MALAKLVLQKDFDDLREGASSFGDAYFGIRWKRRPSRRLGIVVPKKVGTAVQRNRIKRMVRECFRLQSAIFPCGDILVIAREKLRDKTNAEILSVLVN